jgi:hypothetical protein
MAARKVLVYYEKIASKVLTKTDQERPTEWQRGAEVWIGLLRGDPEKVMLDYLDEYAAGHSKFADE